MTTAATTDTIPPDLADALDRVAAGLAAMGAGDPAPYAALWLDAPDVTLFGAWGPVERGHGRWWLVHRHGDHPPVDPRTTAGNEP